MHVYIVAINVSDLEARVVNSVGTLQAATPSQRSYQAIGENLWPCFVMSHTVGTSPTAERSFLDNRACGLDIGLP